MVEFGRSDVGTLSLCALLSLGLVEAVMRGSIKLILIWVNCFTLHKFEVRAQHNALEYFRTFHYLENFVVHNSLISQ